MDALNKMKDVSVLEAQSGEGLKPVWLGRVRDLFNKVAWALKSHIRPFRTLFIKKLIYCHLPNYEST